MPERERAYQEHIAQLTLMLDQAHQQNQRLLEAPRPAPSVTSPQRSTRADIPAPTPRSPDVLPSRSTVRQRILGLLQEYPEGLTPGELRVLLRADRRLSNTCIGMWRAGLLQRVGRGRYAAA